VLGTPTPSIKRECVLVKKSNVPIRHIEKNYELMNASD
jgi:hypothetical protein